MMLTSSPAPVFDLNGTWRIELPRRGGVVLRTYFVLHQDGSKLAGKVVINAAADLPLQRAHLDGPEGVFSVAWNADYRVRREGDQLRVKITYGGKRREEATAIRVRDTEASPLAPLPLPTPAALPANGLALTPPMGWSSWNHFADAVDDRVIREAADALVSSGLAAAGYVYINIDDSWEGGRDVAGNIVPNSKFPDMKALADYVHGRGLKLGLYTSPGPLTCGGYEGSHGHEEQDAETFAAWGIDYLKYDWCSAARIYAKAEIPAVFQKMGEALAKCGRPIVYSLSPGIDGIWEWAARAGANLWRTTDDIQDNWKSMSEIGFGQSGLATYAAPGRWNDPDMLEVGNGGMTPTEYRTHFSLWCLLAAPLIAGNDLRSMTVDTLEILSNHEAIAIDQDILGRQGERVASRGGVELWVKPLSDGGQAVGIFNRADAETTESFTWAELGRYAKPAVMRDLWQHCDLEPAADGISTRIPAHGVVLLRLR